MNKAFFISSNKEKDSNEKKSFPHHFFAPLLSSRPGGKHHILIDMKFIWLVFFIWWLFVALSSSRGSRLQLHSCSQYGLQCDTNFFTCYSCLWELSWRSQQLSLLFFPSTVQLFFVLLFIYTYKSDIFKPFSDQRLDSNMSLVTSGKYSNESLFLFYELSPKILHCTALWSWSNISHWYTRLTELRFHCKAPVTQSLQ